MNSELQQYLLKSIPIAEEMGLNISHYDKKKLTLSAPLGPNINDKETAFAGSLYSAMVLSGWLYISHRLQRLEIDARVVVVSTNIQYLKAVTGDFSATCRLKDEAIWDRFVAKLQKRKNYKLALDIDIANKDVPQVVMKAEYIAWLKSLEPL